MLIGFLYRTGLEQWSYAILADIAAQGATAMRFTISDIDWDKRLIYGETWSKAGWTKEYYRFPDFVRNYEFPNLDIDKILNYIPHALTRRLRKNEQLDLLSRNRQTKAFVPVTLELHNDTNIMSWLNKWGAAILKPSRGRVGQGIVCIRTVSDGFEIEEQGERKVVCKDTLSQFLLNFNKRADRSYILQQFAACTGPGDRYFSVRIIIHKSNDGDWHPCLFPLSLLAQPGSVIANREGGGATNISLKAVLRWRFGAAAPQVLKGIFSAAVTIARVIDGSLAHECDDLALDMAVDERGAPWVHEVNWRGGFWMLEEDIGLYRYGGANAIRLARAGQFGMNIDAAQALSLLSQRKANCSNPDRYLKTSDYYGVCLGVDIVQQSDHTISQITRLVLAAAPCIYISSSTSFGLIQKTLGRTLDLIDEQAPGMPLPLIITTVGNCYHDPEDERSPRKWIAEELEAKGLITAEEINSGSSINPHFLEWGIKQNRLHLHDRILDCVVIEGLDIKIQNDMDWLFFWRKAAHRMQQAKLEGHLRTWGISLNLPHLAKDYELLRQILLHAKSLNASPDVLVVECSSDSNHDAIVSLRKQLQNFPLSIVLRVKPLPPLTKTWAASHRLVPLKTLREIISLCKGWKITLLCPIANTFELEDFFSFSNSIFNEEKDMPTENLAPSDKKVDPAKKALQAFAQFDSRQLFRFFVDGRFHKKYHGWVGYEANESGSVQGILNAYRLMIDSFDLNDGLASSYIRDLHIACMSGVSTANKKSTPGEVRSLESGLNLFKNNSTLSSVQEILDQRRGDGTYIFHHPDYQRPAESFTAEEILEILNKEGRLRYRNWYPNLTDDQQRKLTQPNNLTELYEVKHYIQRSIAERTDQIVDRFNQEITGTKNDYDILIAISRVVRDLELLHPFPDGNGRTFIAILMNHLLLFHGFLPAILWDPNIDAELSVREFAEEIQRGIKNTELLLSQPSATLYGYSINEADPADFNKFQHMAQGFLSRLHTLAFNEDNQDIAAGKQTVYLHLTPYRLIASTGGVWYQASQDTLRHLRFENVSIGGTDKPNQLIFFRNIKTLTKEGKDPLVELQREINNGVIAVVMDDHALAQRINVPVLVVADVDRALYDTGSAIRRSVNCRAVATVGTEDAGVARELLALAARPQLKIHVQPEECKTPQVMASLANLRIDDQLEIVEVATGARINVARHRLRAIEPDYILFASTVNHNKETEETYTNIIKTLAACVDGLREGGLCVVNSTSDDFERLVEEIRARKEVAIQTFGVRPEDQGRLISATFEAQTKTWSIQAEIIGKHLNYVIVGDSRNSPVLSVGALLVLENMGCEIEELSKAFLLKPRP